MKLVMIQAFACGAYGWFQRALIRLCVCAAAEKAAMRFFKVVVELP